MLNLDTHVLLHAVGGELTRRERQLLAAVGESSISQLKIRPDYAITLRNVLVGYVEIKSPGKAV